MKVVCAWCDATLIEDFTPNGVSPFEVSHGICDCCKEAMLADEQTTLDDFLNRLDAPILMVDGDGIVKLANEQALQIVGKDLDQVRNFKGGDVFECVYAHLPEGCGHTVHCTGCTIRLNVMKTYETGFPLREVPATLKQYTGDGTQKISFLISTEKIDDYVLLRIDKIMPETA